MSSFRVGPSGPFFKCRVRWTEPVLLDNLADNPAAQKKGRRIVVAAGKFVAPDEDQFALQDQEIEEMFVREVD